MAPASEAAERQRSSAVAPAAVLVARWARARGTTLTARYGVRSVIRGRLTGAGGTGVANARIELLSAVDGRRAMALDKGGARTRADGRFTLVVGRGVCSRTLLLRYRRHAGEAAAAQARLRLRVRAGVALALVPSAVPGRRAVGVAGRLVGRPLPHRRTLIELQARRPGRPWVTVRLVRAGLDGRFSARYPPPPRRRRELRAVVRATADYPYATGASRPVRIR